MNTHSTTAFVQFRHLQSKYRAKGFDWSQNGSVTNSSYKIEGQLIFSCELTLISPFLHCMTHMALLIPCIARSAQVSIIVQIKICVTLCMRQFSVYLRLFRFGIMKRFGLKSNHLKLLSVKKWEMEYNGWCNLWKFVLHPTEVTSTLYNITKLEIKSLTEDSSFEFWLLESAGRALVVK